MKGEMFRENSDGMLEEANQDLAAGASTLPPFDAPQYRAEIGDLDLTDEQATEFLRALDFILRTFVDLGWGVDSVQHFIPAMREFSMDSEGNELEQNENTDVFNSAASAGKED